MNSKSYVLLGTYTVAAMFPSYCRAAVAIEKKIHAEKLKKKRDADYSDCMAKMKAIKTRVGDE